MRKGNVVRSMSYGIDADYYIMVDGDDTQQVVCFAPHYVNCCLGKIDS